MFCKVVALGVFGWFTFWKHIAESTCGLMLIMERYFLVASFWRFVGVPSDLNYCIYANIPDIPLLSKE